MCTGGFGRGAGYSCLSCEDALSPVLITVGSLFILLIVLLLILTAVFLVGGLDAVVNIHRSLTNKLSISTSAVSSSLPIPSASEAEAFHEGPRNASSTIALDVGLEPPLGAPNVYASEGIGRATPISVAMVSPKSATSTDDYFIGTRLFKVERLDKTSKQWAKENRGGKETADHEGKQNLPEPIVAAAATGAGDGDGAVSSRRRCCGIGQWIKQLWSRVPMDKLKILVVVWQILTVFPSIAAVGFPPVYSQFLSWVDVVNLDLANVLSASCVIPELIFYQRLLVTTLVPIALFGVLFVTYYLAKRRAGIGTAGITWRRAAWSRHMSAGLLLTFLVSLDSRLAQGAKVCKRVEPICNPPPFLATPKPALKHSCALPSTGKGWRWMNHGCGGSGGKERPPTLITTLVPSPPFTMLSPEAASRFPETLSIARLLVAWSPPAGIHACFDHSFQDLCL